VILKKIKYILAEMKLYICNHIISNFPSRRVRIFFYRNIMKFKLDKEASIFMGAWITSSGNFIMHGPSVINGRCHIDTRGGIEIGKNVSISPQVSLVTGDHDIQDPMFKARFKKITIEDHVFIGFKAIILPGVTLGRGAVVCAGSVVTKDVPPLTIVGGVPAKYIGQRNDDLRREQRYSRLFA
jgi:acetyltransferase-like isoleucine patch superfamily enzyme